MGGDALTEIKKERREESRTRELKRGGIPVIRWK